MFAASAIYFRRRRIFAPQALAAAEPFTKEDFRDFLFEPVELDARRLGFLAAAAFERRARRGEARGDCPKPPAMIVC
jgi:hypothetical protein